MTKNDAKRTKPPALPEIPAELPEASLDWLIRRGWRAALRTDVAGMLAVAMAKAAKAGKPMTLADVENFRKQQMAAVAAKIADGTIGQDAEAEMRREQAVKAEMLKIAKDEVKEMLAKVGMHPRHRDGGKGPFVYDVGEKALGLEELTARWCAQASERLRAVAKERLDGQESMRQEAEKQIAGLAGGSAA